MPTRLGQNFLKDETVVEKIIESANLKSDDFVIEVGPGQGILTQKMAQHAGKVLAIEIDDSLIEPLRKKFADTKNIEIIHADILKMNLQELVTSYGLPVNDFKVIANIPYYITSKIIRLFLEAELPPTEMILMIQKEVAERIVAKPGKMSILAVSVQYYADAEILFTVGKGSFDPVPEVDSAVIKIKNHKKQKTSKAQVAKFFRVVRAGFSARRKTLANNLANSLHLEKNFVEEKLKTVPLSGTVRAQELSLEDWERLAELF